MKKERNNMEIRCIIFIIIIFGLVGCDSKKLTGTYKAFWYETYQELVLLKSNTYKYKSEGHLGMGDFKGEYYISNDTLILKGKIVEIGISKFLIAEDGCLIELESRFDYCRRNEDRWESLRRNINYPQLKEKRIKEKEDVMKMLELAFTNPKIRKYFDDTTKNLVVQEYFEINRGNNIVITCFGKPIKLMSKEEIELEQIEEYLIIDEITIGLNRATIDFQIMPKFYKGILDFFYKKDGNWKLDKITRGSFN